MPKIIAFAGRKRSGKTLLSKFLRDEYGATIITIADYLKYLCCDILDISYELLNEWKDNGHLLNIKPNERWFNIISKQADIPYDYVKKDLEAHGLIKDVRDMLQVVGTDIIRKYNPNWHISKMLKAIDNFGKNDLIAIDDVRFKNELNAIYAIGGDVFFVINTFNDEVSNHISEKSLLWRDFDASHIILNTKEGKNDFITQFKLHYSTNFSVNIPNSILLSENMQYVKELNETKNPLIKEDMKYFIV